MILDLWRKELLNYVTTLINISETSGTIGAMATQPNVLLAAFKLPS